MPWEDCTVMDERLRFVARLLEGESMAPLCREFHFLVRRGTKSLTATRSVAWRGYPTARGGPTGMETNCRCRLRRPS